MSKKRTELEIVATEHVQRHGLKDLSFRQLADQVGIKSASVHYHFPGKTDLASALIEKYADEFDARLQEIRVGQQSLKSKLDHFCDIFEGVLQQDKLCLCGIMAAEVQSLDDRSRVLLQQYFKVGEQWLSQVLAENTSELNCRLDIDTLAKIIMSGLEGAILLDRVDGGLGRVSAQRQLIHSFLRD